MIQDGELPDPLVYYLYIYNQNGYHNGKVEVLPEKIDETFQTVILKAKNEKRKVILTDEYDNCMFHMENGQVIFPPPKR